MYTTPDPGYWWFKGDLGHREGGTPHDGLGKAALQHTPPNRRSADTINTKTRKTRTLLLYILVAGSRICIRAE